MTDGIRKTSLGERAVTGLAWGILGGTIGKLSGFLAQIYLGWVLNKEDFALFAIATSCAAVLAGLVNGGTQRVLIQRGQRYDEFAYVVLKISFLFNLVIMVALVAAAIPVSHWFKAPALAPMLVIMGVATLLSTPGHVLHAKLVTGLRFGLVQGLAICSHIVRYGTTVLFAFLGLGPLSFVLPVLVIALTDNLFALCAVRRLPPRRQMDSQAAWDVLKDSRWVMVSAFAGALILNGDNIAVGMLADKNALGVYFFAFQLTFAFASLIGGTLQSVLMPMLANIADDRERQLQGFKRAVCAASLASSGLAMLLIITGPLLVHLLWGGKWDEAIQIVQILSLALPALLVSWIGRASIEARGRWATVTCLSTVEGFGTILVAAVGAAMGGLPVIAVAVAIFKIVAGLTYIAVAARSLGAKPRLALLPVCSAYATALGAFAIGYLVVIWNGSLSGLQVQGSAIIALVCTVAFFALSFLLCRTGVAELRSVATQIRRRIANNYAGGAL